VDPLRVNQMFRVVSMDIIGNKILLYQRLGRFLFPSGTTHPHPSQSVSRTGLRHNPRHNLPTVQGATLWAELRYSVLLPLNGHRCRGADQAPEGNRFVDSNKDATHPAYAS